MAVTGKFLADFTSFYTAVGQAELKLRSFEEGSHKVEAQLKRTGDAFSGTKIIQAATITTEAIERLGGATKLTEAEQRKVNAEVTEAIAKYKALGEVAPKAMVDLANATKRAEDETKKLPSAIGQVGSTLTTIEGAFGIAFSARRIWHGVREQPVIGACAVGTIAVAVPLQAFGRTGGPLCRPDSTLQAHAAWHVLTAFALACAFVAANRRRSARVSRPAQR